MTSDRSLRVLVVEDETLVGEMLKGLLGDEGHVCIGRAANGTQAVEMTRDLKPDVVLMDIQMPDMDGIEASRRIGKERPTPVVIMTAFDTPELVQQAREAGVSAYLLKVPDARTLDRTLSLAVARFQDWMDQRRLAEDLRVAKEELEQALADLQQTQLGLLASDARVRALLNAPSDAIVLVDRDLTILEANSMMAQQLGAPLDQLAGNCVLDYLPAEYASQWRERSGVIMRERSTLRIEGPYLGRWFDHVAFPIFDERGEVAAIGLIARDITEKRQMQAELAEAQKMEAIGRLAGGIAHDFNNLLTSITGFAELMELELPAGSPLAPMVRNILTSGQRAAHMVKLLIAFSQRQVTNPVVLNLAEWFPETIPSLRAAVGEGVGLCVEYDRNLWPVRFDPDQLQQVMVNLAKHAGDSMAGSGRFTIAVGNVTVTSETLRLHPDVPLGDFVQLSVTDTGPEIDSQTREHLFEPFSIFSPHVASGIGLRLAAVYGMVKQNRGHVVVENSLEGGTTFRVFLPRDA